MTAPPTPGRDSRVEKLAEMEKRLPPAGSLWHYYRRAARKVAEAESAGLLVLDPSSLELADRIAQAVINAADVDEGEVETITRAVLAALGSNEPANGCLRQSVNPTGHGAVVEGYRADCTCGWRTGLVSRSVADALADAHALASPGGGK